jgi:hypothetical protein
VTDSDWLAGDDPRALYAHLRRVANPRLARTRRRLRLYACACCRHVWDLLGPEARAAVEVSERYADGLAGGPELSAARRKVQVIFPGSWLGEVSERLRQKEEAPATRQERASLRRALAEARFAAVWTTSPGITPVAWQVAMRARQAARDAALDPKEAFARAGRAQAGLLRDLFGDLSRSAAADVAVPAGKGNLVREMARAIYDERRFDELPVLADALEDAGCSDEDLLGHCRSGAEHVRGCWALDLVRGRD